MLKVWRAHFIRKLTRNYGLCIYWFRRVMHNEDVHLTCLCIMIMTCRLLLTTCVFNFFSFFLFFPLEVSFAGWSTNKHTMCQCQCSLMYCYCLMFLPAHYYQRDMFCLCPFKNIFTGCFEAKGWWLVTQPSDISLWVMCFFFNFCVFSPHV